MIIVMAFNQSTRIWFFAIACTLASEKTNIESGKKLAMDHQTTPIATAGSTRLLRTVWYLRTCARIYSILSNRNGSAA
jgi:hypothetical protein